MYLISAYFDNDSNKKLNKLIKGIADKTGNTFMTDNDVPAHMTISSIEARSEDVLFEQFGKLQDQVKSETVQIVSVGQLFPYVIFAGPVLNKYLQELSKEQMQIAFSYLQDNFVPLEVTVTRIGLAKFNPHEDIATLD